MRLTTRLQRWQQAGLLTETQVAAIVAHEKHAARFSWQNGLYFLAVFAIVVGILSVIAANWQYIPGGLKITIHLLVNAAAGVAILQGDQRQQHRRKELLLFVWFGLIITFIGLVGQVFHLSGSLPAALSLWLLLGSPAIVLLSNSRFTLLLWLIAVLFTLAIDYAEYVHPLIDNPLVAAIVFIVLIPVAMAALSHRLAGGSKTALRQQLAALAPMLPILGTSIVCQFWYGGGLRDDMAPLAARLIGVLMVVLAAVCSCYPRVTVPVWLGHIGNLRLLLMGALVAVAAPFLVYGPESALVAALSFTAFWLLVGYIGHRTNTPRLISLAILVITARVYIIYLEVFGSLLQTGFGLIASGLLLLAMLKLAQLLNRNLRDAGHTGGAAP